MTPAKQTVLHNQDTVTANQRVLEALARAKQQILERQDIAPAVNVFKIWDLAKQQIPRLPDIARQLAVVSGNVKPQIQTAMVIVVELAIILKEIAKQQIQMVMVIAIMELEQTKDLAPVMLLLLPNAKIQTLIIMATV